ncbi:helix-turn-helix domain-containing protein [Streptomyces sp. NPDC054956]
MNASGGLPRGKKLRSARLAKGLSVRSLSQASGVPTATIYGAELGRRMPHAITALAEALGILTEPPPAQPEQSGPRRVGRPPTPLPADLEDDYEPMVPGVAPPDPGAPRAVPRTAAPDPVPPVDWRDVQQTYEQRIEAVGSYGLDDGPFARRRT